MLNFQVSPPAYTVFTNLPQLSSYLRLKPFWHLLFFHVHCMQQPTRNGSLCIQQQEANPFNKSSQHTDVQTSLAPLLEALRTTRLHNTVKLSAKCSRTISQIMPQKSDLSHLHILPSILYPSCFLFCPLHCSQNEKQISGKSEDESKNITINSSPLNSFPSWAVQRCKKILLQKDRSPVLTISPCCLLRKL